jgi:hypothetical protein
MLLKVDVLLLEISGFKDERSAVYRDGNAGEMNKGTSGALGTIQ